MVGLLNFVKRPVIRVRCHLIKQPDIAAVKGSRIHHEDGDIAEVGLQRFQQRMYSHEWKYISDTGQHQDIANFMGRVLNFRNELSLSDGAVELLQQELLAVRLLQHR